MADILVVCTGNVCRSPLAEAFLRTALERRFHDRAPSIASAGTAGWEGDGAQPNSVAAAAERGVDISEHVARVLEREMIDRAALVVAMASEHRDAVAELSADAARRTFTLKELVRLLEDLPEEPVGTRDPTERLAAQIGRADELRASGFDGNPRDEDVADPLGMPVETYRAVAWELDEWCERLASGLSGRAGAPAAAGGGT